MYVTISFQEDNLYHFLEDSSIFYKISILFALEFSFEFNLRLSHQPNFLDILCPLLIYMYLKELFLSFR